MALVTTRRHNLSHRVDAMYLHYFVLLSAIQGPVAADDVSDLVPVLALMPGLLRAAAAKLLDGVRGRTHVTSVHMVDLYPKAWRVVLAFLDGVWVHHLLRQIINF
jgi:hypothetical protein